MRYFRFVMIGVFILMALVGRHLMGKVILVDDQTMSLTAFVNHTADTYVVYQRSQSTAATSGPSYTAASADWQPLLVLHANERGTTNVTIRDAESFGSQIKLAPKCNQNLPTYYISSGVRSSGDCKQRWFSGPFAINVTLDERSLGEPASKHAEQVRYCGYKSAHARAEFYADGIEFHNEHNLAILDKEKVTIKQLKAECIA